MDADARRGFLGGLIDDAGLFPPASLSMEAATDLHASSRAGPHAWMLARFVCPASRLPELAKQLGLLERWRLSVLLDPTDVGAGLELTAAFVEDAGERVTVELIEAKLPVTDDSLGDLVESGEGLGLGGALPVLEVEPGPGLAAALDAIAEELAGAKLRTGGATEDLFPTPAAVAAFLVGCRDRGLRCKATAGLHHPFRHRDPATGFVQHGFVNLVGAAVLARAHALDVATTERIVAEERPEAFELSADGFRWRDLEAPPGAVAEARGALFFSYGSCSFAEPVEDLLELGVLPA